MCLRKLIIILKNPTCYNSTQIKWQLEKTNDELREHKDKKVFGILAAINMSAALKERVLSLGACPRTNISLSGNTIYSVFNF